MLIVWSDAERVETAVLEEIARLSGILSTRDPRSEISRIGGAALSAAVDAGTAAVLLEPIQGETGIHVLSDELLVAARA